MQIDALPNSLESEQSLLGGMLINPKIIPYVAEKITLDDLYYEKHQELYSAILRAPSKDMVTIWDIIDKSKVDKQYFMSLGDVTTSAAWEYHAEIIKRDSNKRRLWKIGMELKEQAALPYSEYVELISKVKTDLLAIESNFQTDDYDNAEHYMHLYNIMTEKKEPGLFTGIDILEDKIYFEKGYLHAIAAESGLGKSAFALKVADSMARRYGTIDYYSFESNKNRLSYRNISRLSKVALTRINKNSFTDYGQERQIQDALVNLCDSKLYFYDNPKYMEIERLITHAESRALKYKTSAIFVDYIQMAQSINKRMSDRKSLIENALFKLKGLAKSLNIPIIYICQLRKDIEGEPSLDDLYETNALRQATDNIIFIYTPMPIQERLEKPIYPVKIYSLKGKDQSLFQEWFEFNGHFQEFTPCVKPEHLLVKKRGKKEVNL